MSDFTIFSPVNGDIVPLEKVPDPAFAEKMLGDGLAINPADGTVVAPCDATISHIHKSLHAITLRHQEIEILIHIGVDSVSLNGEGFKAFVQTGDSVKQGQPLISFQPEQLAKRIPCNWVIIILTSPEGASLRKTSSNRVKAGKNLLFSLSTVTVSSADTPVADSQNIWTYSQTITISDTNGLHARPAATLARAAKQYPFLIELEYQSKRADIKSLVSVMGLGLSRGAQVRLRINNSSDAAQKALKYLTDLLINGLEEKTSTTEPTPIVSNPSKTNTANTCKGLTACRGIAIGMIWQWTHSESSYDQNAADPTQEQTLLDQAIAAVLQQLTDQCAKASAAAKSILQAHQELLQDPVLLQHATESITKGRSASAAFNEAIRASIDVVKNSNNKLLAERIADLKDIRRQVLEHLSGKANTPPQLPENCIVVAEELLPSEIAWLDERVQGVLLSQGSPTAHASILLRNKGIPTLVAVGPSVLQLPNQTPVILYASDGKIQLNPSSQQQQEAQQLQQQIFQQRTQQQQAAHQPAITQDGVQIFVSGNASNLNEAQQAQTNGADGLGLVRTEFLFYKSNQAPTEQEQYSLYQQIADTCASHPITLRTLDVGGDKPVSYIALPQEQNPILGLRGVRNYEQFRDLFLTQIRAMLKVKTTGPIHIMLPMISFLDELQTYKQIIEEEKKKLDIKKPISIGIMVEVPSAALLAEQFAPYVDFFSIGTNDLTQYTLAIDRGHKTLCAHADPLHPAVLRLIDMTCKAAQKYKKHVAVCGAVAGDLEAVALLIGLGVTELAVSAGLVAPVKALIRTLNYSKATQLAQQALQCSHASQVRDFIKKEFSN